MNLNVELFLYTLPILLKGMLGIFAVTLVIILAIYLLNKFTKSKKEDDPS